MATSTKSKTAAKRPDAKPEGQAPAKAEPKPDTSKKDPVVVETFDVRAGDAHAVITLNGNEYRFDPDQVLRLRRQVNVAFVELH